MKLLEFNVEQYKTGNFDTVLGNGEKVTIAAINPQQKYAILGWAESGESYAWEIDGSYGVLGNNMFRLYLATKKTTVHITVTRNKDGKINVYGCTDRLPNVYKRSGELLKRLTVEIDD